MGMAAIKYLMGQIDGGKAYSHLIPSQTSQLFQRLFITAFWSPQVLVQTWAWLLGGALLTQANWCVPSQVPLQLLLSASPLPPPSCILPPLQILQLPTSLIYLPLHQISF